MLSIVLPFLNVSPLSIFSLFLFIFLIAFIPIVARVPAAKNAAAGKGKYTPGKGVTKDFKLDPNFKLPGV